MLKKLMASVYKKELASLAKEHETQINDLRVQIEQAQVHLESMPTLKTNLDAEQQAHAALKTQLQQLKEEKLSMASELEQAKSDIEQLRSAGSEAEEAQNTSLKSQLDQLQEEFNEEKNTFIQQKGFLQGQLSKLEAEKQASELEFKREASDLEREKNAEIAELKNQIAHVQHPKDMDTFDASSDRKTKLILIVDDALTTRALQKSLLDSAGFDVVLGKDGEEGRDMFQEHLPDLVITDVEMPKMDGFELTRWIRKDSPRQQVPVLMVTSHGDSEFQEKAKQAGADDFIQKDNFNKQSFLEMVSRYL